MSALGKIILSLIIAIVSAVVSWGFEIKGIFNLIVSLLFFIITFLVIEMVSISGTLRKVEETNSLVLGIIRSIFQITGPFSIFYNVIRLMNLHKKANVNEIIVPKEEVLSFWSKTVAYFDKSFFATSYIDPEEAWTMAYTHAVLTIQGEKVKQGKQMRRVFIVDSEDELKPLIPIIREQRKMGIEAKYILHDEIRRHRVLSTIKLESIDFVLIDNEFILLFMLDKKRKISNIRLIPDKEEYGKYSNFYEHLFSEAREPGNIL